MSAEDAEEDAPPPLSQHELDRLWELALHEERVLNERSGYFLIAHAMLLVFAVTAIENLNPAAVLATIIIGAVMSLFWFLVNRRQQDEMKTAVMLVRDQLPGYTAYVKARSNSGLRKFGPAVFIYGIPIAVTFIWVVFAAERLFVWLNL
ncbi:hypothetical protein L5876_01090 [Hyphobacterium sp. SN044]|uniref:RipA family octameric membrane protein n=1 Tax=Hyphobacterium sp. SN044 TaxID=2912575 RepID=UPI001F24E792|nr:hypothetical protein [Hyphobacterium sp. SN044]MCF8878407.1 hypothetical protein [Hyphobacterium sp. SN044]